MTVTHMKMLFINRALIIKPGEKQLPVQTPIVSNCDEKQFTSQFGRSLA